MFWQEGFRVSEMNTPFSDELKKSVKRSWALLLPFMNSSTTSIVDAIYVPLHNMYEEGNLNKVFHFFLSGSCFPGLLQQYCIYIYIFFTLSKSDSTYLLYKERNNKHIRDIHLALYKANKNVLFSFGKGWHTKRRFGSSKSIISKMKILSYFLCDAGQFPSVWNLALIFRCPNLGILDPGFLQVMGFLPDIEVCWKSSPAQAT